MSKCPKCGEEITYLHGYKECKFILELNDFGEPTYNEDHLEIIEESYEEFECPECCEAICDTFEQAKKFLKGEV